MKKRRILVGILVVLMVAISAWRLFSRGDDGYSANFEAGFRVVGVSCSKDSGTDCFDVYATKVDTGQRYTVTESATAYTIKNDTVTASFASGENKVFHYDQNFDAFILNK